MAGMQGNVALAMGRSKLPVITGADGEPLFGETYEFSYGEIVWAREGTDACVLTMGTVAGSVVAVSELLAEEGLSVEVGIVACPLALDAEAVAYAAGAPLLFTVEDHNVRTGLGASVALHLADQGTPTRLIRIGVEDYQSSGASPDVYAQAGIDADSIARRIREELARG